jgi:hypothetical protein
MGVFMQGELYLVSYFGCSFCRDDFLFQGWQRNGTVGVTLKPPVETGAVIVQLTK